MRRFTGLHVAFMLVVVMGWTMARGQATQPSALLEPPPIVPGAKVVTLWPPGSPQLKNLAGYDKPEKTYPGKAGISHVENIHNPSIELHLAPADKANGMAIIVAAGGGNS